jgi:RNA polymerase sigma-70 factor (ECF subfamily)
LTSFRERIARLRRGEVDASELVAKWRPLLRLRARGLLGRELSARADSSDVVQEALSQAIRDADRFRGTTEGEWMAWLQTILSGQAAKLRRFHHAEKRNVQMEMAAPSDIASEHSSNPIVGLVRHEHMLQLAKAIESLPESMRAVVVLRAFDQHSFEQIGAAMGRSPGAVRVLWTRAIRQLRGIMDGS